MSGQGYWLIDDCCPELWCAEELIVPRVGDPERAPATIARPIALKVPEVPAELRSAEESDGDVMAI